MLRFILLVFMSFILMISSSYAIYDYISIKQSCPNIKPNSFNFEYDGMLAISGDPRKSNREEYCIGIALKKSHINENLNYYSFQLNYLLQLPTIYANGPSRHFIEFDYLTGLLLVGDFYKVELNSGLSLVGGNKWGKLLDDGRGFLISSGAKYENKTFINVGVPFELRAYLGNDYAFGVVFKGNINQDISYFAIGLSSSLGSLSK